MITAAMCQGNKLEKVRDRLPDALLRRRHLRIARRGLCRRPGQGRHCGRSSISTRRSCSEPSIRSSRRSLCKTCQWCSRSIAAGLTGPDGPTHHGVFRHRVHAAVPQHDCDGPGRRTRRGADAAIRSSTQQSPVSLRYPKANLEQVERAAAPVELGQAEVLDWGTDAIFVAYGTLLSHLRQGRGEAAGQKVLMSASSMLASASRSIAQTLLKAVEESPLVVTVEEGTLEGGFGSALLEAANAAGLDTRNIVRPGIPDRFIEHAERSELLADLGLSVDGLCASVRQALAERGRVDMSVTGVRRG